MRCEGARRRRCVSPPDARGAREGTECTRRYNARSRGALSAINVLHSIRVRTESRAIHAWGASLHRGAARRYLTTSGSDDVRFFLDDPDDSDDLDAEFPLGDGTADTEGDVCCPYCGEMNTIALDPGSGAAQEYIEDCQVCCQPWRVLVSYDADGGAHVRVEAADDS